MHGFEKKKEHKEEEKKQPPAQHPLISMTEGPMQLKSETEQHERERILKPGTRFDVQLLDESKPIQEKARKNYEKSLELEIAALKKAASKMKRKAPEKKKPRYGWKMDAEPPPEPPDDDKGDQKNK